MKKTGMIAKCFKSSITDQGIQPAPPFGQYIEDLYKMHDRGEAWTHIRVKGRGLRITSSIFDQAIKKLSREKACGLDALQDYWLKDARIIPLVKDKIITIMNTWLYDL